MVTTAVIVFVLPCFTLAGVEKPQVAFHLHVIHAQTYNDERDCISLCMCVFKSDAQLSLMMNPPSVGNTGQLATLVC